MAVGKRQSDGSTSNVDDKRNKYYPGIEILYYSFLSDRRKLYQCQEY
jgi:hypothetical protein